MKISKRLFFAVLLLPILGLSGPVSATQGFSTGEDLKQWCADMNNDDTSWGLCVGSITAGHDMIMTYQNAADVAIVVCMPEGANRGDAVKALVNYMAAHPEELIYSLGDLVFAALADRFPCP